MVSHSAFAVFAAAAALLIACAPASAQQKRLTARQVVERIQKNVAVPWRADTVDTFKTGDPDAPVTGIAVAMMGTYDVLQRAAAKGLNMVITHEPIFYGHRDATADLEAEKDPVYAAKKALIEGKGLVVFRFHDHWHARRPDGVQVGMVRALGWEKYRNGASYNFFTLPEIRVDQLAAQIRESLHIGTLRVVGDPALRVTKVAMSPGAPGFGSHRATLQRDDVEALLIGEAQEWETIEYAVDAAGQGKRKALIVLGHIPSEQAGMEECARWLKTFVSEVPVEFLPTAEPFWAPR
jgi:putative NIF3 family GTP cyclohydrolase 1 type 2